MSRETAGILPILSVALVVAGAFYARRRMKSDNTRFAQKKLPANPVTPPKNAGSGQEKTEEASAGKKVWEWTAEYGKMARGKITVGKLIVLALWFIGVNVYSTLLPENWRHLRSAWPFPFWTVMIGIPSLILLSGGEKAKPKSHGGHGHGGGESVLKNWGILLLGLSAMSITIAKIVEVHHVLQPRPGPDERQPWSDYWILMPAVKRRLDGGNTHQIFWKIQHPEDSILIYPGGTSPPMRESGRGPDVHLTNNYGFVDLEAVGDKPVVVRVGIRR